MPSTPEEGEASASQPSNNNGDPAEIMERGESTGPNGHPPSSSAATTAEPDAFEPKADSEATTGAKHHQSISSSIKWKLHPEIPRSDSRGRIHTYDEGGVRVVEGADGRIHVIRDGPS